MKYSKQTIGPLNSSLVVCNFVLVDLCFLFFFGLPPSLYFPWLMWNTSLRHFPIISVILIHASRHRQLLQQTSKVRDTSTDLQRVLPNLFTAALFLLRGGPEYFVGGLIYVMGPVSLPLCLCRNEQFPLDDVLISTCQTSFGIYHRQFVTFSGLFSCNTTRGNKYWILFYGLWIKTEE